MCEPTVKRSPEFAGVQTREYGGTPPATVNEKLTGAQLVAPHGVVAGVEMSAGAVIVSMSNPTACAPPPANAAATAIDTATPAPQAKRNVIDVANASPGGSCRRSRRS